MINNIKLSEPSRLRSVFIALAFFCGACGTAVSAPGAVESTATQTTTAQLTPRQQSIIPIAALAATGDVSKLAGELEAGLDNGLTINEIKEILVQVYAYAGFPRSLNALNELMRVQEARSKRGIKDPLGNDPSRSIPTGEALLEAGTANQTKLIGSPAKSPIYDFAPVIDHYLKTHLFGDIFERDNLDWQSRELATVAMLAALVGTEAQLTAHMGFSMNVGVTPTQLRAATALLSDRVSSDAGQRASDALDKQVKRKSQIDTNKPR